MTFAAILQIISGVLQFPGEILRLINVLKSVPEQKHEELVASIEAEAKKFADTGRPQWS